MKNLKRMLCVVLTMMMACSVFAGCGKDSGSKVEYEKGAVTESSFTSDFIGLEFEVPEGYSMLTQEQMDENMKQSTEIIYKDDKDEVIDYAKTKLVYEMMCAEKVMGVPNVNIVVEENKSITEKKYLELSTKQLEQADLGYKFDDPKENTEFKGHKYLMQTVHVSVSGLNLTQDIYVRKIGDRVVTMTITYNADEPEGKETIMNAFKAIEE